MKETVLIVEDEQIIAETLRQMLKSFGYTDVLVCSDLITAKQNINKQQFKVVLLDINIEGNMEGLILGKACKERNIPFLYVTSYSDGVTLAAAKETLPGSYVTKPFTPRDIRVAVELTLMHHESHQRNTDKLIKFIREFDISPREGEILSYLAENKTNKEIAEKLFLSANTVKFHLSNVFAKTNTKSRKELSQLFL
jgi:DNA-binding NarL/FixJ family response regulator